MRFRCCLGLLCGAALASGASAQQKKTRPQFGGAVEWRTQVGTVADSADRRTGLALRFVADGGWMPYLGWRAEGAYIQAQYERRIEGGTVPLNESGYEIAGFVRAGRLTAGKWVPYAMGGSILSLRGTCSLDNGFSYDSEVRCEDATTIRVGWGAGAGVRYRGGMAGWDFFMETRFISGVTSASGGKLFAISFGAGM